MQIFKAQFKGYKGLRKVSSDEGQVTIDFPNSKIHCFFGENGSGKSTLINSLNPFILPNGHSDKKIESFITYPGEKTICFNHKDTKYKSVITFKDKGDTKAKLYNEIGGAWLVVDGFESGKTTVYTDMLKVLFGVDQDNISKINHIGQNSSAIIESKPSERREMIYPLMGDLSIYDDIIVDFEQTKQLIDSKVKYTQGVIDNLKELMPKDVGNLVFDDDAIEGVKLEIKVKSNKLDEIKNSGKKNREKEAERNTLAKDAVVLNAENESIEKNDDFLGFPNEISVNYSKEKHDKLTKDKNQSIARNTESGKLRVSKNIEKTNILNKIAAIHEYEKELLSNISEEELLNSENQEGLINNKKEIINNLKAQITVAEKKKIYLDDISGLKKKIKSLETKNKSLKISDVDALNDSLREINKEILLLEKDTSIAKNVFANISKIKKIEPFTADIEHHFADGFGNHFMEDADNPEISSGLNLKMNEIQKNISDNNSKANEKHANVNNIKSITADIESKIKEIEKYPDNIDELKDKLKDAEMAVERAIKVNNIFDAKNRFVMGRNDIPGLSSDLSQAEKDIAGIIDIDLDKLDKDIALFVENKIKFKANEMRTVFNKNSLKISEIEKNISVYGDINAEIDDGLNKYKEVGDAIVALNKQLEALIKNKETHDNYIKNIGKLKDSEAEIKVLKSQVKAHNQIKLYGKNLKETALSKFMIKITELANDYLASDEDSSIDIELTIRQKGQNFEILAHQDEAGEQDIKTLSGAEKSTVNRALATALAFYNENNIYGIYTFDETDSALSDTNKKAFANNIISISEHDKVEQLFIISHDTQIADNISANLIKMENL